jgi:hypothetical protein
MKKFILLVLFISFSMASNRIFVGFPGSTPGLIGWQWQKDFYAFGLSHGSTFSYRTHDFEMPIAAHIQMRYSFFEQQWIEFSVMGSSSVYKGS